MQVFGTFPLIVKGLSNLTMQILSASQYILLGWGGTMIYIFGGPVEHIVLCY